LISGEMIETRSTLSVLCKNVGKKAHEPRGGEQRNAARGGFEERFFLFESEVDKGHGQK
jgi:hypothetical protein